MRFFKSVLLVALLVVNMPTHATEIECKRWDNKCVKAQKKAQFTQAYFRIMVAGITAEWNPKKLRDSFTKEEQRDLKKIGLDVTNVRLVSALEQKYVESFSTLDPEAWQSVLDSILNDDYVAQQVKYKLMNVAVVDRLRKELENSGKKTVKAKSGNFSTRSSSRPAVVVLEDMRRAQSALIKELSKAEDELDIDILAEALEKTTIILVRRNEHVAKALSNPKEFEKLLVKASDSSGIPAKVVFEKMSVAGSPAIQVVKETAQRQLKQSKQLAQRQAKQTQQYADASTGELVAIISSMNDDAPSLPTDLTGFTRQELSALFPESTAADYAKMMREYARYAKLEEAEAIAKNTAWTQSQPGSMYHYVMADIYNESYNGVAADALIQKMDADTAEVWAMLKDLEARIKVSQNALDQEIKVENIRKANGTEYTDEEEHLEELHWYGSRQIAKDLELLMQNTHAAVLLSDDQINFANNLFDDAFKLIKVSQGSEFLANLQNSMIQKSEASLAVLERQLKLAEQEAANDVDALAANKAYVAMASTSVAKAFAKDMAKQIDELVQAGHTYEHAFDLVEESVDMEVVFSAFDAMFEMVESDEIDKDLAMQAIYNLRDIGIEFKLNEITDGAWNQLLVDLKLDMDKNAAIGSLHDQMEQKFQMEDAATMANMAELQNEIAKIQDQIDNIQQEYDKAISMGASPAEATAYMQDQQAQMQAGMAELCQAGDSSAC